MAKNKIRLQGHEKFSLRDGWLNKGISLIDDYPDVFLGKEGSDIFGIGNNMVKSLRYWLKAFRLIEEKAGVGASLTQMGRLIKENDKYFEDPFTLWILHSTICKNVNEATTWYMFFNKCEIVEFDKKEIELYLNKEITKYVEGESFSEQSLKNDIDVLLNMYSKESGKSDPEDKNISPFARLQLIKKTGSEYLKNQPDKRIISEINVLYELSFMMNNIDSVSIDALSTGENSLSAIYHLSRITINEMLDRLDSLGYIRVNRTAGLDIVYKLQKLDANKIIENYYKKQVR